MNNFPEIQPKMTNEQTFYEAQLEITDSKPFQSIWTKSIENPFVSVTY